MTQTLSIFVFVLFWINLSVSSVNIYFSIKIYKNDVYSASLRGTKERLLEINPNYFLEKEIENPKELRNLSNDKIRLSILIINACSFYFILKFLFLFALQKMNAALSREFVFMDVVYVVMVVVPVIVVAFGKGIEKMLMKMVNLINNICWLILRG